MGFNSGFKGLNWDFFVCLNCDEHRQCSQYNAVLVIFCYFGSHGEKLDKRVLHFLKLTVQFFFLLTFLDDVCARSRWPFIASAGHFTTCRHQSIERSAVSSYLQVPRAVRCSLLQVQIAFDIALANMFHCSCTNLADNVFRDLLYCRMCVDFTRADCICLL